LATPWATQQHPLYELLAAGGIESITIDRLHGIPAETLTAYSQLQRAKNDGLPT
jgi:hypothetical protein